MTKYIKILKLMQSILLQNNIIYLSKGIVQQLRNA